MSEFQVARYENADITTWDFAMFKAELQSGLDAYAGVVYTDETIGSAKNDRATLNKVKKVIEDARKEYKARCLAPYEALEPQIKELVEMVEKQRTLIDETVKDYENRQKEAKELEVRQFYNRKAVVLGTYADILYPKLFDKKWLNASTSRAKCEESILIAINGAVTDMEAIRASGSPFVETLLDIYAETLSMEQVKAKQNELETAAKKASLTTAGKTGDMIEAKESVQDNILPVKVDCEAGTDVKIYATENQWKQLSDFMKVIGVRYELL